MIKMGLWNIYIYSSDFDCRRILIDGIYFKLKVQLMTKDARQGVVLSTSTNSQSVFNLRFCFLFLNLGIYQEINKTATPN